MKPQHVETAARTTREGVLNLSLNLGVPDADVAVVVDVRPMLTDGEVDETGWPVGYFESLVGSMPELQRADQGAYEQRQAL